MTVLGLSPKYVWNRYVTNLFIVTNLQTWTIWKRSKSAKSLPISVKKNASPFRWWWVAIGVAALAGIIALVRKNILSLSQRKDKEEQP